MSASKARIPSTARRRCCSCLPLFLWLACPAVTVAQFNLDYATGKALFEKNWVPAPASTGASDGLGPFYDARSCAQCHPDGGRGDRERSLTLHIDDPVYGGRLQRYAVPGFSPEAAITIERAQDGRPIPVIDNLRYGPLADSALSLRLAPSLRGVGLLAGIADAEIAANADPDDRDGDGVSGRVNRVVDLAGKPTVGRFGWKAEKASLADQTAVALSLDLGLGSPALPAPAGDCTPAQADCLARPQGGGGVPGDEEVGEEALALLLTYVRALNRPAGIHSDRDQEARGAALFRDTGCGDCHLPQIQGAGRVLYPYTDLLLHDMGPGLADDLREGGATGPEWRTAPLWGLGQVEGGFLHDGRADTVQEAIDWHDGEAAGARDKYRALEKSARDDVIAFLFSL